MTSTSSNLTLDIKIDVLESAKYIADRSMDVSINSEMIEKIAQELAKEFISKPYDTSVWSSHPLHPTPSSDKDEEVLNFVFTIDTLNFAFWYFTDSVPWSIIYKNVKYTGYWALVAALNRAKDEGIPEIIDPSKWNKLTLSRLEYIFRSDSTTTIPLLKQRLQVLQTTAQELVSKFNGSVINLLSQANGSAPKLLSLIVNNFSSYRDINNFSGRSVQYLKRAQILVADIWGCFQGKGFGALSDINTITVFADYRVPQILLSLGLLKYTPRLLALLKQEVVFESGSKEEAEIRGSTIWSCELLRASLVPLLPPSIQMNSILLDFYLWDLAKSQQKEKKLSDEKYPIHRVRSIYY